MIKTAQKNLSSAGKICYFDCFSGISGDMILGALVDAGVTLQKLEKELSRIPVKGYKCKAGKVRRSGFSATKVDVVLQGSGSRGQKRRQWKEIEEIIRVSTLSSNIKKQGISIFKNLFQAEAKVHGGSFRNVHLHELGAVDCIVDIFGALIGLDLLGVEDVYASPLNLGGGSVKTSHGTLSVPAPATSELLRGVPVFSSDSSCELTTPTGAAIISSLSKDFTNFPHMRVSAIGAGAGDRDIRGHPNILRIYAGDGSGFGNRGGGDFVRIVETNIDDMNPEIYEYVMERLFKAGALDVFLTQIIMKKGRPGIKLTVLCGEEFCDRMTGIILEETTSIGLRFYSVERRTLKREIRRLKTKYGIARVKLSRVGDEVKVSPEYEDCKKIAKKHRIPLIDVMKMVASQLTE